MSGLKKYFNGETYSGRANVAKATYASFALLYLYFRVRRAVKKPDVEEPPPCPPEEPPTEPKCQCYQCQPACPPGCSPASPPPCPPTSSQIAPSQPPPAADDGQKKSLTEDPLFKQKIQPPPPRKDSINECDDDEYDDRFDAKK